MNDKQFIIRLIASFIAIYLIILITINYFFDPYMETRIMKTKFNQYKFEHSAYSSTFLFNKLKKEKSILIFGTSRSHQINNEDFDTQVLNMHSIYGTPYAVENFIFQLSKNQINNIIKVYYLLDNHTFNGKRRFTPVKYDNFFAKLMFMIRNTNYAKIQASISMYKKNKDTPLRYINYNGSYIVQKEFPPYDPHNRSHRDPLKFIEKMQGMTNESFKVLYIVDRLFKKHNIKVVYFTAPVTMEYIALSNLKNMIKMREKFLNIIDGFYDLTYVKGISDDNNMFLDFSHTRTNGKNKYVNILKSNDKKYFITKKKFHNHINFIKKYYQLASEKPLYHSKTMN